MYHKMDRLKNNVLKRFPLICPIKRPHQDTMLYSSSVLVLLWGGGGGAWNKKGDGHWEQVDER